MEHVIDLTQPAIKKQKLFIDIVDAGTLIDGCKDDFVGKCSNCFDNILDTQVIVGAVVECEHPECSEFMCLDCIKDVCCKQDRTVLCVEHQSIQDKIASLAVRCAKESCPQNSNCDEILNVLNRTCSCVDCLAELERLCLNFFDSCRKFNNQEKKNNLLK